MSHRDRFRLVVRCVIWLAWVVVATGATTGNAIEVVAGPTLTMDPNGLTPLAGLLEVTTDVPSTVTLFVVGGDSATTIVFPDMNTDHSIPVLGFKPAGSYAVHVTVTDTNGNELTLPDPLPVLAAPLPPDFPILTVLESNPALMEPGFTLMDPIGRESGSTAPRYAMIVDSAGEVIWFSVLNSSPVSQLEDGTLLYPDGQYAVRSDMLGNVLDKVFLQDPGGELHHDLYPTDHDTYLSLTRVSAVVPDYPTSTTDPSAPTQNVVVEDNWVAEFSLGGASLGAWSLMDLLDPSRIGYLSLTQHPFGLDWGHANSIVVDPSDGGYIASLRHQDAVVKFDPLSGDLQWILGPHANWDAELVPYLLDPVGPDSEWFYSQHAAAVTSTGTLILFDNGIYRASPFDGQQPMLDDVAYSRAVEFAIDEAAMTVDQVWEFTPQGDDRIYSPAQGDADLLPQTGNVLVTFSSIFYLGGIKSAQHGLGKRHVRIIEVDHDTPPNTVFDLRIHTPDPDHLIKVYRADRIASLYGAGVVVSGLQIFADDFEEGGFSAWSTAVP